jgi:hypothetical protein
LIRRSRARAQVLVANGNAVASHAIIALALRANALAIYITPVVDSAKMAVVAGGTQVWRPRVLVSCWVAELAAITRIDGIWGDALAVDQAAGALERLGSRIVWSAPCRGKSG